MHFAILAENLPGERQCISILPARLESVADQPVAGHCVKALRDPWNGAEVARDNSVGEDIIDIVAHAEAAHAIKIKRQRLGIGDRSIVIGIGIEDRPAATRELESLGADTDAEAAVEIAVTNGETVARGNALAKLAIVGKANAGSQPRAWGDRIGGVGEQAIALGVDVGHVELDALEEWPAIAGRGEEGILIFLEIIGPEAPDQRALVIVQPKLVIMRLGIGQRFKPREIVEFLVERAGKLRQIVEHAGIVG